VLLFAASQLAIALQARIAEAGVDHHEETI
jgi:hypothetical protein